MRVNTWYISVTLLYEQNSILKYFLMMKNALKYLASSTEVGGEVKKGWNCVKNVKPQEKLRLL